MIQPWITSRAPFFLAKDAVPKKSRCDSYADNIGLPSPRDNGDRTNVFCLKSTLPSNICFISQRRKYSTTLEEPDLKTTFKDAISEKQALMFRAKGKMNMNLDYTIKASHIIQGMRCAGSLLLHSHKLICWAGEFQLCSGKAQSLTRRKVFVSKDVRSFSVEQLFPGVRQAQKCSRRQCSGLF